jgi:hypothetical protein
LAEELAVKVPVIVTPTVRLMPIQELPQLNLEQAGEVVEAGQQQVHITQLTAPVGYNSLLVVAEGAEVAVTLRILVTRVTRVMLLHLQQPLTVTRLLVVLLILLLLEVGLKLKLVGMLNDGKN